MKLIGSKVEDEYRLELKRGRDILFSDKKYICLFLSIKNQFPEIKNAYVIDWIPDQGEDIFTVLVDSEFVAVFEIPKMEEKIVDAKIIWKASEYGRMLKKHKKIKFLVALDMVSKEQF